MTFHPKPPSRERLRISRGYLNSIRGLYYLK